MIYREGEPVRAQWSDGRTAVLMEQIRTVAPFDISMPMNGSTCSKTPPARCRIKGPARFRKMFFVWETHPTRAPGTMLFWLNAETKKPESPVGGQFLATQDTQAIWRDLGLKNALDEDLKMEITCDRFDWLPFDSAGEIQSSVMAPAWVTNFETPVPDFDIPGIGDNSAIGQFTSIARKPVLKRASPGAYIVDSMRSFTSTVHDHGSILRGYITSFLFDRSQFDRHPSRIPPAKEYPNPGCEVEFTLSFAEYFALNNIYKSEKMTSSYDPREARVVKLHRKDPQLHLSDWVFKVEGEIE